MKSEILKRKIGIFYFILFAVIFIFLNLFKGIIVIDIELQRFLICCAFGFLGMAGRTFVYYGLLKNDKKQLYKKQIGDCESAYFLYYPAGLLAVTSIIFVASYENLKNMSFALFISVSFFLFCALGFAVNEAMDKFLFKTR